MIVLKGHPKIAALAGSGFLIACILLLKRQQFWHSRILDGLPSPFETQLLDPGNKTVVMAKIQTDETNWVEENLPDWGQAIYHVDEPDYIGFHTPQNKGRESMAYLTYIIDSYENLPKTVAFIHPHRTGWPAAWHNDAPDYDPVTMLTTLREEFVQEHGYANLRCLHDPGCPGEIRPFRGPYAEGEEYKPHERNMAAAWVALFGGDNSTVPEVIATPCCSQFAVSKAQILARPRTEYEHYRDWLLKTPLDDFTSGRIFEYLWQVIFGGEPVHCPTAHTCYCEQFGRC